MDALLPLLSRQDGAVTVQQAYQLGITRQQLRTLEKHGWSRPVRGVLVEPEPLDPFRAGLRAALLACPDAAACKVSGGRLHGLSGLRRWHPSELPELLLPAGTERAQRQGMRISSGLRPSLATRVAGFPVTTLDRTIVDLSRTLRLDDRVCMLDSALRKGWLPPPHLARRQIKALRDALKLADGRSESVLETLLRLLLVRAGLTPETLQYEMFDERGVCFARLDFAWPSVKLAVEADGREHHDKPEALYADRRKQNALELDGWTVLRFTWDDVVRRPAWVAAQVRAALARAAAA